MLFGMRCQIWMKGLRLCSILVMPSLRLAGCGDILAENNHALIPRYRRKKNV